jgi:CDP-diacylglycerol--serine O-phosphatidyltransferase
VKKIAILPTLFTLGNAVCGFTAIVFLARISPGVFNADTYYYLAISGWLILGAMLFDALDGHVARLSKTASEFGGQLDSLCDGISFGVAPAFLLLRLGSWGDRPQWRQVIAIIATLYMVCTLIRLARFNVENNPDPESHKRFRGLPSPAAAGCIASLGILCFDPLTGILAILPTDPERAWPERITEGIRESVQVFAPFGGVLVAFLMVSRVSYPHMTNPILRGRKSFRRFRHLILAVSVTALLLQVVLVPLFWGYTLIFASRHALLRLLRRGAPGAPPSPSVESPPLEPKWPPDVHRAG